MRSYQQIPSRPPSSLYALHEQFRVIEMQNRELIKLAESIHRSSFMPNLPPPPIIHKFQEEIRANLTKLIEGIRQVFMDTERKLAVFAQVLQQQTTPKIQTVVHQPGQQNLVRRENVQIVGENAAYRASNSSVDPYSSLIERISQLEASLKNTQRNQARLLSMIEKLQKKSEQHPSQTTDNRNQVQSKIYRGSNKYSLEKSKTSNETSSTFRLFSLLNQPQNRSLNIDRQSLKVPDANKPASNLYPCFNQRQSGLVEPSKLESSIVEPFRPTSNVPNLNIDKNYASNHSHRLHFMVNTLNS